jgi:hypothetical protein
MHATPFFALDRWRAAGRTGPGLRPATWAGQHRSGVALVISRHVLFGLFRTETAAHSLPSFMIGMGGVLS